MTRYQKYHKNYTELGETYQLVLPLCLEGLIPEDESVRLLSHELEEPNYALLYQAYSAKGRNPAVDPKTMPIPKISIRPETSKKPAAGILILCGFWQARNLLTTVPLPGFVPDFL